MRGFLAAVILACLLAGAGAQPTSGDGPVSIGPSPALARSPSLVVLIHHTLDQVDPFGVPFGSGDSFSARYADIAAQTGRFDFPVFVADGVTAIQQLPDPARPFEGTLEAYQEAVRERSAVEAPLSLGLRATVEPSQVVAAIRSDATEASSGLPASSQEVRLLVAVVEDAIHYKPPAPVSNGVEEHRFTVRALVDVGPIPLADWSRNVTIPLRSEWKRDHLSIAAWLQAGPVAGRFAPREVVQAISAPLDGIERFQLTKGVLVEAYSATWCDECLYGDLAIERLAITAGAAQPLEPRSASYWTAPQHPLLVAGAALAAGAAAVALARRRP